MKKIVSSIFALILVAGACFAQDLAQATELYNNGAAALASGNKEEALNNFQQAIEMAAALGADGEAIIANCKNAIPKVNISIAKGLIKDSQFDQALELIKAAAAQATEFGEADAVEELTSLVSTALMMKGNSALSAKNFAAAAEAYKDIIAQDAANGMAALRLGQALAGLGQNDDAIAAFEQAAENGQKANAVKQLSTIFVKKAAAALKAKDNQGAFDAALKSIEYTPSANAYKVAGTAAMNLGNKADAIANLEKYIEASPAAADAVQIKAAIEALKK